MYRNPRSAIEQSVDTGQISGLTSQWDKLIEDSVQEKQDAPKLIDDTIRENEAEIKPIMDTFQENQAELKPNGDTIQEQQAEQNPNDDTNQEQQAEQNGDINQEQQAEQKPNDDINQEQQAEQKPNDDTNQEQQAEQKPNDDTNQQQQAEQKPNDDINQEQQAEQKPNDDTNQEQQAEQKPNDDTNQEQQAEQKPNDDTNQQQQQEQKPNDDTNQEQKAESLHPSERGIGDDSQEHLRQEAILTAQLLGEFTEISTSSMVTSSMEDLTETTTSVDERENLLTIFTSWKSKREKYECHNNTLYNWNMLQPNVTPIVFSNEQHILEEATGKGWTALPLKYTKTKYKLPVLKELFQEAMDTRKSAFYAYSNSDILFTNTLIKTLSAILESETIPKDVPLFIVGRRTNVKDVKLNDTRTWHDISLLARDRGKLFTSLGEDYFIARDDFPWDEIPEVVIGRVAYDNFLVWYAKRQGYTVIDATATLLALHQTTRSGNGEGRRQVYSRYNSIVLGRIYQRRINYFAGRTTCAKYFTKYVNHKIVIRRRSVARRCTP